VITKSFVKTKLALCYLLCRGLSYEVVYSGSLLFLIVKFLCGRSIVDSEILQSGEGGEVEQWLEPRNKFFVFAIALSLSLLLLFHLLASYSFIFVGIYSFQQESN